MTMAQHPNQDALDAALAQIDRAFGKGSAAKLSSGRVNMKVWLDPFTEQCMFDWLRYQVEGYLPDDFDMADKMWEDIGDDMANGDHRVLEYHPFDRMYPPVTIGERIGLFFRRLFGRFQRSESQKIDAELAKIAPAPRQETLAPSGDAPF